jgi:hypothetical protein
MDHPTHPAGPTAMDPASPQELPHDRGDQRPHPGATLR